MRVCIINGTPLRILCKTKLYLKNSHQLIHLKLQRRIEAQICSIPSLPQSEKQRVHKMQCARAHLHKKMFMRGQGSRRVSALRRLARSNQVLRSVAAS